MLLPTGEKCNKHPAISSNLHDLDCGRKAVVLIHIYGGTGRTWKFYTADCLAARQQQRAQTHCKNQS